MPSSDGLYLAVGLMSGTSMDGIDAALVRTDGEKHIEPLGCASLPYDPDLQVMVLEAMGARGDEEGRISALERQITLAQSDAVREVLEESGVSALDVDVIGFHGQTLTHAPSEGFTWQIGDGALMADDLGIAVVNDFRRADVSAGGQGAPLMPLYHAALVYGREDLPRPVAVLNLGGVANVTWIGADYDPRGETRNEDILAFDTGPGNALLDDFIRKRLDRPYDKDGSLARSGSINQDFLLGWLSDPFFEKAPPKSLDRNAFKKALSAPMADADGAATLAAFTIYAIEKSLRFLPELPLQWLVTGGGRHNEAFMTGLRRSMSAPVRKVEEIGWNGDMLEAEGFAWLAVRTLKGLPLSLPRTTGVRKPMKGGTIHRPSGLSGKGKT